MKSAATVDSYISSCEPDQQTALQQIRQIVHSLVPEAEELISYGMPAFKYHGLLVWYAAQKEHYGLYPKAAPIEHFAEELKNYDCSKGTIRLPRNKALPTALIKKIVKYCVILNLGNAQLKLAQKSSKTKSTTKVAKSEPKQPKKKSAVGTSPGSGSKTLKKAFKKVAKKSTKKSIK